ncbi:MAG TPA: hypothetical protein VG929_07830, partial [Actinomycetota bacterium]|nr:hypothetical protein [Actinomycetota bacterium]
MASARSEEVRLESAATSHGAVDCDDGGINIGYEAEFFNNTSPRGYRVTDVVVSGIDTRCNGHDLKVALMSGGTTLGATEVTPINAATMVMPLSPRPLAQDVDAVYAELDDQVVPPTTPTPTVTPTPTPTATPTPTPTPTSTPIPTPTPTIPAPSAGGEGGGGDGLPATSPSPSSSTAPSPGASTLPSPDASASPSPSPLPSESGGTGLPPERCDPATATCGSTGDDSLQVSDGTVVTGPGKDTIIVATDPSSSSVNISSGKDDDVIVVSVSAGSTSEQTIRISTGSGDDTVRLSFASIEPGAVVHVDIFTGAGADVVGIPAFLPPGVTVSISTGPQDDAVITRGSELTALFDVTAMGRTSGGYVISGDGDDDVLNGGLGPDTVMGRGGHDELAGGAGNDRLGGARGNDRVAE